MTGREPASSPPDTDSAAAAWLALSDELLRAVNHELSNRLAALGSVSHLLEYNPGGLGTLPAVLRAEIAQLEGTLTLLRLLPRNPTEAAEPIRVSDLLSPVLALHRLQSHASELEYVAEEQPNVLPVWIRPSNLVRALLLLLSAAARSVEPWGKARVAVRCSGNEEFVTVLVEAEASEGEEADAPIQETEGGGAPDARKAVEELLRGTGGEVREMRVSETAHPGIRFELRLPTLLEIRRREQTDSAERGR